MADEEALPLLLEKRARRRVRGVSVQTAAALGVAMLVGASASTCAVLAVQLNKRSTAALHAVYVSNIINAFSIAVVSIPALCVSKPWVAPRRWWPLVLGGVVTLPTASSIAASQVLGIQVSRDQ